MISFTLRVSKELNTWLEEQAKLNQRSKNKHIEHILELTRKADNRPRFQLGVNQLCHNGTHLFASSNPAMSEFCNCRMFMFGEVR